jgi:DNA-binding LacI/PurR family transcriptional regulator
MVSMKQVAALAGVSISTVSRVINNTIPVDTETRERVEKVISDLGYKPSIPARNLRANCSQLIGLVLPATLHESFSHLLFSIAKLVEVKGYELVIRYTSGDPDEELDLVQKLAQLNVDGFLFVRSSDGSRMDEIVREAKKPIVNILRATTHEAVPSVVLDNHKAGRLAGEVFLRFGHRQVVCITGGSDIMVSKDRLRGFREVLAEQSVRLDPEHVYHGDFRYESGCEAVKEFVAKGVEFSGIWAMNDLMAVGAMNCLQRMGFSVPSDVSVMGMDNAALSNMVNPALTTIAQPFGEMARTAVECLFMAIEGKARWMCAKNLAIFEPFLVLRDSMGPAAGD